MNIRFFRFFLLHALSIGVLTTTGCNSLTNPYIGSDSIPHYNNLCISPSNMRTATKCISGYKNEYIKRMGDQALLSAWTGLSIIPLATYTAGLGLNGNHQTNLTDFSLGTAGLYGMATWLSKPQRTQIYGLGLSAMECAISATSGFDIENSIVTDFENNLKSLDSHRRNLSDAVLLINIWMSTNQNTTTPLIKETQNRILLANTTLTQAATLSTSGWNFLSKYKTAPKKLVNIASSINSDVNIALTGTTQSLTSLPGTISGVLDMYSNLQGNFSNLLPEISEISEQILEPESEGDQPEVEQTSKLKELLAALTLAHSNLKNSYTLASQFINTYYPSPPVQALENCGVDTSTIPTAITITPESINFTTDSTASQSVTVSGGSQYVYASNSSTLEIEQTPAFGNLITISLNDNPKAGNYAVVISDINGQSKILNVTLTSTLQTADIGRDNLGEEVGGCSILSEGIDLSDAELELCNDTNKTTQIQSVLKTIFSIASNEENPFIDGDYGLQTRARIQEYLQMNPQLGDEINDSVIEAIITEGE